MIKLTSENNSYEIESSKDSENNILLNGQTESWDIRTLKEGTYHVIYNHRSYTIDLISMDFEAKQFEVSINGQPYAFSGKDANDMLLERLGMEDLATAKTEDIKAPMPGLVLSIEVKEGDAFKKGDTLLVLEAMKMENNIKAPEDGVVKSINVSPKEAVERNQILISLD